MQIDARERGLIDCLTQRGRRHHLEATESSKTTHPPEKKENDDSPPSPSSPACFTLRNLHYGDVVFGGRDDDDHDNVIAFERKTLADWCASIKDGRYKEQKHRLMSLVAERGGRVAYIIEGKLTDGTIVKGLREASLTNNLQPTALESCLYSLLFKDRVATIFTRDVEDTADVICTLWARHQKELTRPRQQRQPEDESGYHARVLVENSVHGKRNKNITRQTCYLMQLCQIPGVSHRTAEIVQKRWPTMADLFAEMTPVSREQRLAWLSALPTVGKKSGATILEFLCP